MAHDYIPRPDAQFHARRNTFATHVNAHPTDLALAAGATGAAIQGKHGDPPPTPPLPGSQPQKTQRGQGHVVSPFYFEDN